MHSGRRGGVVAVQSSFGFIRLLGMWMETTRCDEKWKKCNRVMCPGDKDATRANKVAYKA